MSAASPWWAPAQVAARSGDRTRKHSTLRRKFWEEEALSGSFTSGFIAAVNTASSAPQVAHFAGATVRKWTCPRTPPPNKPCSGRGNAVSIPSVVAWRSSGRSVPRCKVVSRR